MTGHDQTPMPGSSGYILSYMWLHAEKIIERVFK